ncbi:MAG TPA: hypothetical protein VMZ91_06535 [Candidatus Paceibacterota bacterium]|nr:hypothetical protein [Candidatus Paceibacterota bacterium]
MAKKITPAKKCKVCGKILRDHNKSGLCSHHYRIKKAKEIRKIRIKNRICVSCKKKVEPIILYPAGKIVPPIIKYPIRCYACRTKYKKSYLKKQKDKQKK